MRSFLASAVTRSRTGPHGSFGGYRALKLRSAASPYLSSTWGKEVLCQSRGITEVVSPSAGASVSSQSLHHFAETLDEFKKYFNFPQQSPPEDFQIGKSVSVHGFLGKRRDSSSKISSVSLFVDGGPTFRFTSRWAESGSPEHQAHLSLRAAPSWSSVCLTGLIDEMSPSDGAEAFGSAFPPGVASYKLSLESVQVLSPFPKDIIVSAGARYPPTSRHLQLRFTHALKNRIQLREYLREKATALLSDEGLSNIETPVLFKSTPEGAREFLVPTRRPGYAYALPQSPQQYKQILMAGGFRGYYQIARCFRDEDLRADRQPEFTQLDLEMSFVKGEDVMRLVEKVVKSLYESLRKDWHLVTLDGEVVPGPRRRRNNERYDTTPYPALGEKTESFPRLRYQEAMAMYGCDKPDLRILNKIQRIDSFLTDDFVEKITHLGSPIVEACKFRLDGTLDQVNGFMRKFFDSLPATLANNPDGQPAVMICQPGKPLSGFSPLGYEASEKILSEETSDTPHLGQFEEGDILIVQARENKPFQGGSTALGNLRTAFYHAAVEEGLLPRNMSFKFLWVTGFPMFTPNNDTDPGQGGTSGFSSTHHPFTAPLTPEDFELLATDPLKAEADHYDLVVNGVELGGGSRRIHIAQVQEFVLRDILKMSDDGVAHFAHLLEALRAGCPPHAGFAFGWDRLVATLSYTGSVRDVIAFPKSMKGEEMQTKSPGRITSEQLETYHLAFKEKKPKAAA